VDKQQVGSLAPETLNRVYDHSLVQAIQMQARHFHIPQGGSLEIPNPPSDDPVNSVRHLELRILIGYGQNSKVIKQQQLSPEDRSNLPNVAARVSRWKIAQQCR
jgi:hypothetical protein